MGEKPENGSSEQHTNRPQTKLSGLSEAEVSQRVAQGLDNRQPPQLTKTNWQILRDNVFTSFNAMNLAIALCLLYVHSYKNMLFMVVVILNSMIGVFQELRSRNAVRKLSLISAANAKVMRDGKEATLPFEQIVLDDILVLDGGQQISADSIIRTGSIEVNESLLTGESDSISKDSGDTLLSGSFVIGGRCLAQVQAVGESNYATQVTQAARAYKPVHSEIFRSLQKVFRVTGFIIPPVAVLLFIQAFIIRQEGFTLAIETTAAAILGMLPKGLMLLTSMSLGISVYKLATKNRTLVRDLYSIETLAHVDTLCLDKTGTLTEGKMSVHELLIESTLPAPFGEDVERAISAYLDASKDNNATSMALSSRFAPQSSELSLQSTVTFSSERKWSSVTFANFGTLYIGAPDILAHNQVFPEAVEQAQKKAQRVLCFCYGEEEPEKDKLPTSLSVVAWILLEDPLREDAKASLELFQQEGVTVKIISGDHPRTVSAVAHQLNLSHWDECADASAWTSDEELQKAALSCNLFGRVRPEQKLKLVEALQNDGHKVAMIGDGVNDVLALKKADCSVAMAGGSDVARQVAQVVLVDSTLSALPAVLMEGRRVVNNITRVASLFFMKTVYSTLLSILAVFTGSAFPFIPIQITLMDLALEGYPAFFLALEPRYDRIQGTFLRTVFDRAAPSGILVVLYIFVMQWLQGPLKFTDIQTLTVMYFLMGWCAIVLQYRASRPLNGFRAFLLITSGVGFYVAAMLFHKLLALSIPTIPMLLCFAVLAAFNGPLCILMSKLYRKTLEWIMSMRKKRQERKAKV